MIFDSHAHYDDSRFDEDRDEIIMKAHREGVGLILNVGAGLDTSQKAIELAEKYDFIYASAGMHPHDVESLQEKDMATLYKMAAHEKVMAIGEIGLDYFYDNSPRELQKKWFIQQLDVARQTKLPIIIHSRDATSDMLEIMKKENVKNIGGVVHCFSGGSETMEEIVKMGFYISFGGTVTFKNAAKVIGSVKNIPEERLLIETDCPYLSPEPQRGKRNYSSFLKFVIAKIADVRGTTTEYIEELTCKNAIDLFKIPSPL